MRSISDYYWWLVTQTVYRRNFQSLGRTATIRKPILLSGSHRIILGDRVYIRDGSRIEIVTERYGKRFSPTLIIGDGTIIEQNLHLVCSERVVIGKNVGITENVGIFDTFHSYEDPYRPIISQELTTKPVRIGDGSFIGIGAVVHPGVEIGENCIIGANSVVTRSIPDRSVAVGSPARVIRTYNKNIEKWVSVDRAN